MGIVFEKEFSELPAMKQKRVMSEYVLSAVMQVWERLRKKIVYNFELMEKDFSAILHEWRDKPLAAYRQ